MPLQHVLLGLIKLIKGLLMPPRCFLPKMLGLSECAALLPQVLGEAAQFRIEDLAFPSLVISMSGYHDTQTLCYGRQGQRQVGAFKQGTQALEFCANGIVVPCLLLGSDLDLSEFT